MNFNEYFQNEIEKLKNEVLENINKTVENLNEKIEERISNIDIKSIERASNNSLTAINRLNTFYTTSKGINDNIQSKLKLTSLFLSFIGGATLASLLFYFIF
jgi:predicted RNase H-like nuclease (RuvC/YqgF family)